MSMPSPRPSPISAKALTANADPRRVEFGTLVEFAAVTLIWGSTWLVIKGQLGLVPAEWSVAYRFVVASAALVAFCLATGRWRTPTRAAHGFAIVVGFAQFMLNFNLVYAAERHLTSGLVALIFALLVVPNAVLARIFLGTPITGRFAAGSTLGLGGLVLVFARDLAAPAAAMPIAIGVLLTTAAVVCASTANVMQAGRLARSLPSLPTLALTMAYGALMDIGYAAATVGAPVVDWRPSYLIGVVYLAVVASVLAFSLYYRLIRRIGPGRAAYTSVLTPVVAMTLSTVFEGYRWTGAAAAGVALAVIGLAVALGGRGRASKTGA